MSDVIEPVENACDPGREGLKAGWEDQRHAKLVKSAANLVWMDVAAEGVSEFRAFWTDPTFQSRLFAGLHDADYENPYYNNNFFWSHFYDPTTGKNYLGWTDPTAYTETLKYFREGLQQRYGGNNSEAAYRLGLALHYLTDLSQPMHPNNWINLPTNRSHSMFELIAEDGDFPVEPYHELQGNDREWLSRYQALDTLVKDLAVFARPYFAGEFRALAEAFPFIDFARFEELGKEIVKQVTPFAVKAAAAVMLYWARGYEEPLRRIYRRVLARPLDDSGRKTYTASLCAGSTIKSVIVEISKSDECLNRVVLPLTPAQRRDYAYELFFHRKPDQSAIDLSFFENLTLPKWSDLVNRFVDSPEYTATFSEEQIPGYIGISVLEAPPRAWAA